MKTKRLIIGVLLACLLGLSLTPDADAGIVRRLIARRAAARNRAVAARVQRRVNANVAVRRGFNNGRILRAR